MSRKNPVSHYSRYMGICNQFRSNDLKSFRFRTRKNSRNDEIMSVSSADMCSGTPGSRLDAAPYDDPQLALNLAAEAGDDARGERVVEAEGVPDGKALLPHPQPLAIAPHHRPQQLLGAKELSRLESGKRAEWRVERE